MTVRAGIIGLGVGEAHIGGYRSHPDCEVVALCDFDDEKRSVLATKYPGMQIVKEASDILENQSIDVVSVASYDNHHYEQIVQAIIHGKHVFVEKPLCLTESHARHIRELLLQHPSIRLSSNLILRMSPRFRALKKMVQSQDLGTLYYVEGDYNYGRLEKITQGWRGKIGFYSVVYGGAVHLIDLLLWLTEDMVTEVTAYGNNISSRQAKFPYNDMVVAILKFRSGMVGKVCANFGCVFPHFHQLALYGTKATFINGPRQAYLYSSRDKSVGPRRVRSAYPGAAKGDLIFSFVDSIINGTVAEVKTDDVFKAMSVCFAIENSLENKQPATVNYFQEI
jgi:predicted dehydrogenase